MRSLASLLVAVTLALAPSRASAQQLTVNRNLLPSIAVRVARFSPQGPGVGRGPVTGDDGIHIGAGSGRGMGQGPVTGDNGIHIGAGSGRGVGRGVPAIGGVPIIVIDGVVQSSRGSQPEPGRFGIASECEPSCSVNRTPAGEYYYEYDGYPRIGQVRPRSAADGAGLRAGDLIIKVEGRSILEDGAILNLEQRDRLHMTVRRDNTMIDVVLVVP